MVESCAAIIVTDHFIPRKSRAAQVRQVKWPQTPCEDQEAVGNCSAIHPKGGTQRKKQCGDSTSQQNWAAN